MKFSKILCASLLGLCAVTANAQSDIVHDVVGYEESAYGETKGFVATKSSTGSKMDLDILEIPQSVSVVTKDFIQSIDAQTIQNVTAYSASVNQPYGENGDSRTDYGRIRGIGRIYTSSFLDGLKLLYGGNAIPKYDAYALERVEILKGPASVLYGSAGPGGLLNLQSKKPNNTQSKEFGLSLGSNDTYSVFTDINEKIDDKISIRVTGKYKEGDSDLKRSTTKDYFFNPSLTYKISDDSTLDILTSIANSEIKGGGFRFSGKKSNFDFHNSLADRADILGGAFAALAGNPALAPVLAQNIKNDAKSINDLNLSSDLLIGLPDDEELSKEHKSIGTSFSTVINNSLTYKNNLRYMKQEGTSDYSIPDLLKLVGAVQQVAQGAGTLKNLPLSFNQDRNDVKTFAFDNNIEYKSTFGSIENTTLAGFDIQYTDFDAKGKSPVSYNFDLTNPTASQNQTINKNTATSRDFTNKITQLGLYVSNSMKIDSMVISAAIRKDKLKNKNDNHLTNKKTEQNDDEISTRLGFTYLFNNGLAPYVSYSTSFQANVGTDSKGNTFKPSVGKQYEIGAKYRPSDLDALFSIAAFKTVEEDILQTDPTNFNRKIQLGDAQVKGIEIEANANINENTSLLFSFAKLSGKEKNTLAAYENKDLGDIPDYKAAIWAQHKVPSTAAGDLSFGLGIKYIGEQKSVDANYAALDQFATTGSLPRKYNKIDAYTLVDMRVASEYKDWQLALNVKNVFDKIQDVSTTAVSKDELQGRTFNLTAKYSF